MKGVPEEITHAFQEEDFPEDDEEIEGYEVADPMREISELNTINRNDLSQDERMKILVKLSDLKDRVEGNLKKQVEELMFKFL